jgi:hypothetical protein
MTDPTLTIEPVRTSVTVEVSREHAFAVFTDRFDSWWPRSHHIGDVALAEARMEPQAGGRWYERRVDGTEGEWGTVLVWDPPGRVVLGWELNADFQHDPDLVTEVEVTFTADGPHRTHVLLEHRNLDRYGERGPEMRNTFSSQGGWQGLLETFGRLAESTPA